MMIGTNDISVIEVDVWWRVPGVASDVVIERTVNNIKGIVNLCMKMVGYDFFSV